MAQFITLTGLGKLGGLRVNLDHLVAYYSLEYQWNKKPQRGSVLDMGSCGGGEIRVEGYRVMESPEEIDRLINPTGTP